MIGDTLNNCKTSLPSELLHVSANLLLERTIQNKLNSWTVSPQNECVSDASGLLPQRKILGIAYICMVSLSNVLFDDFSVLTIAKMADHIVCTCRAFLQCEFSSASSNFVSEETAWSKTNTWKIFFPHVWSLPEPVPVLHCKTFHPLYHYRESWKKTKNETN